MPNTAIPFVFLREYGDILLEHERNYGSGMDALVTVFS